LEAEAWIRVNQRAERQLAVLKRLRDC
jgi:hypothetical protein